MPHETVMAILAGGQGKRLWPLSNVERPKQFAPLFAGRSMLQLTFARAAGVVGAQAVYLIGNARYEELYRRQLPQLGEENLILEPAGRGTAPAVTLAALIGSRVAPGAVVVTIPADHVIPQPAEWVEAIRASVEFARAQDYLVCLGSPPSRGKTKFGYLVTGEVLGGTGAHPVKSVDRFVEKPDFATLDDLISSGACLRNMGTLAFRPDVLEVEMERFAPDTYRLVAGAVGEAKEALQEAYEEIVPSSVDEAILQHSDRVAVTEAHVESADGGDFVTLGDALGRDDNGNASLGRVVAVEATDNTVLAPDILVALVGVSGLVVVVEGDHILVCPAEETQRIREISENN